MNLVQYSYYLNLNTGLKSSLFGWWSGHVIGRTTQIPDYLVCYSDHDLNIRPFNNPTLFDNSFQMLVLEFFFVKPNEWTVSHVTLVCRELQSNTRHLLNMFILILDFLGHGHDLNTLLKSFQMMIIWLVGPFNNPTLFDHSYNILVR